MNLKQEDCITGRRATHIILDHPLNNPNIDDLWSKFLENLKELRDAERDLFCKYMKQRLTVVGVYG